MGVHKDNDVPTFHIVALNTGSGTVWAMWASGPPTFSTVWAWPTHFFVFLLFFFFFYLLVTTEVGHVGGLPTTCIKCKCRKNLKSKKKNVSE